MAVDMTITLKSIPDFIRYLGLKPPARKAVFRSPADEEGKIEYRVFVTEENMAIVSGIFIHPTGGNWKKNEERPGYIYRDVQVIDGNKKYGRADTTKNELDVFKKLLVDTFKGAPEVLDPLIDELVEEIKRRNMAEATWHTNLPPFDAVAVRKADMETRNVSSYGINGVWAGSTVSMELTLPKDSLSTIEWHVEDISKVLITETDNLLGKLGYEVFS